ncbi:hypothetical protein SUGI_0152830 [Cryptomeria japonica]|nr:hypothetical protein SUGI_0152830 [Cryptomeria japonica]
MWYTVPLLNQEKLHLNLLHKASLLFFQVPINCYKVAHSQSNPFPWGPQSAGVLSDIQLLLSYVFFNQEHNAKIPTPTINPQVTIVPLAAFTNLSTN